jgi:hypothetical protein
MTMNGDLLCEVQGNVKIAAAEGVSRMLTETDKASHVNSQPIIGKFDGRLWRLSQQ